MDPASRLRLRRRRRFIRAKSRAQARLNPLAQIRDDKLAFDQGRTASDINLLIAPPLKVSDCSQITDGAAAVLCARNISSKECNRAGPCGSSALRTRRIICR
jgi:acetyl-CoA acetyltransferase